jgi:hypothetical protein
MESGADTENKMREGLYHCRPCGQPFTVTMGTVMESSHIPLSKWLMAFFLFADSKKSLSAAQLQRALGLGSYRSAWHMAHRVRHAMANGGPMPPFSGDVEADETFIHGKPRYKTDKRTAARLKAENERPVAVLVSRQGQARARALNRLSKHEIREFVTSNTDIKNARLLTDESKLYTKLGREFGGGHERVKHKVKEYVRGDVHNNSCESFNGLFKRSIQGSWHHISREHAGRYLDEQCFRWNNRDVDGGERALRAVRQAEGVRLYYRQPKGRLDENGQGLVAG